MTQKTKAISLIAIILLITVGVIIFLTKKTVPTVQAPTTRQTQPTVKNNQEPQTQDKQETTISGKLRSINGKQIFVELSDGSGSAINISATTPVKTEADNKVGNLTILKTGAMVSVTVDKDNNAVEILIKK